MRQGQRFKARLNERPSGQIHCSQLLQQNRPRANSRDHPSEQIRELSARQCFGGSGVISV
jgi:hypothetical protein